MGSGKTTVCRKVASSLHPGLYRVFDVPLSTGNVMDSTNPSPGSWGAILPRDLSDEAAALLEFLQEIACVLENHYAAQLRRRGGNGLPPAPQVRTAEAIMGREDELCAERARAQNKRVWASLERDPAEVTEELFQEALRRDPEQRRVWAMLVDGHKSSSNISGPACGAISWALS